MPKQGQTAIVVPVPAAEPLLTAVAEGFPGTVRDGDPGHVSLLYPFLDTAAVDGGVIEWLRGFAARQPARKVVFDAVSVEGDFVYLAADALAPVTAAIRGQWPDVRPYDGRFGDDPPAHLTVAMAAPDPAAVAALARQHLPLTSSVDQLWLLSYTDRWSLLGIFPFTG